MLTSTFIHIKGVGKKTEKDIWDSDIYTWQEFLEKQHLVKLGSEKKQRIADSVQASILKLKAGDYSYFHKTLPASEHWRAYKELKDKCCFLDIETTGLDRHNDVITMIGIYNGKKPKIFVRDKNLADFHNELKKYPLIVTFNGRCFDIPFIKRHYPVADTAKLHIDLRFVLANLGFRGGLKNVESQLNLRRDESIKDIDGFEAVNLWHKYQRGDQESLTKLTNYLKADIVNLKPLMDYAYEEMKNRHFYERIDQ